MILPKKMKNTHLSRLLSTLTSKELKLLKKWVASPFFNQRSDVIQLLDIYLNYRKKKQPIPTKQKTFNLLFPNEAYDDHRIRMVMSFLNRLTEKFIIYQEQEKKTIENKLNLLTYYRKKEFWKPYQRLVKEIDTTITKNPNRSIEYYQTKHLLNQEKYEVEKVAKRYLPNQLLQPISDNLDITILLTRLKESNLIQNDGRISAVEFDLGLTPQLIAIIDEHPTYIANPAIATYYAAHQLLNNINDANYFQKLRKLVTAHNTIFSRKELFAFYTFLTGFCIINYNKGKQENLPILFELFQEELALGLHEHKITSIFFKNIVLVGLNSKAYDWVKQFIHNYVPKLEAQYQHAVGNWAHAALAHRQKDYDTALTLLQTTKTKDYHHNLTTRVTMTKIYFELKEWDVLQSHLKAFEIYTRRLPRTGELKVHKRNYLNFIQFIQKILRLKPHHKTGRNQLLEKLQAATEIVDKQWLLTCFEKVS